MRNENETFHTSQPENMRQEIAQMRESVDLARSDIRRTKTDVAQYQRAHESHVRRTTALWVLVILLVGGAVGFSWYGSPLLQEHRGLLGKMPALQSTLDNVNMRVVSAEQTMSEWANDRTGLSDRMSKIEKSVGANLQNVRSESRRLAEQIKNDTGQRLQALQNRITGIESIQREHSQEVARLRNELSGVRADLDGARQDVAAARQDVAGIREENAKQTNQIGELQQGHQATRNELTGLDRRVSSNQTAVSGLAYQVERRRVDFELRSGGKQEVVDGIYLTVDKTDVERQRVNGWVQIVPDGRFMMLRSERAQNPIDFSSRSDARTYQLVFTRIDHAGVGGYILAPIAHIASASTN